MSIPEIIDDSEILVRSIHYPRHIKSQDGSKAKLKKAAFKSPPDKDEVSVTRLNYSSLEAIKAIAVSIDENERSKGGQLQFVCLASVIVVDLKFCCVDENCANVKSSPLPENVAHADIFYGFVVPRGEPAPEWLNLLIDKVIDKVHLNEEDNFAP